MGFRRRVWPTPQRIIQAAFPAARVPGPFLFDPAPALRCCDERALPPEFESLPRLIQDGVKAGVQLAQRDAPPATVAAPPWQAPPFWSRPINKPVVLIVGGAGATASAASAALYAAATIPFVSLNGLSLPAESIAFIGPGGAAIDPPNGQAIPIPPPQSALPWLVLTTQDNERLHFA